MSLRDVTLHDRYDLTKTDVLLNGTQALVRLMLMQKARDAAAGHDTAGYVTGYRGSPLGAVDMMMARARKDLEAAQVTFQAGLNEDLAATAMWGTQQAELRGEGKHDGVFGLWYGKGPGCGPLGRCLPPRQFRRHGPPRRGHHGHGGRPYRRELDHLPPVRLGHDRCLHCRSSARQGVQEILDYGLYGFALCRGFRGRLGRA